jgi:hypothetical protein
MDSELEKLKFPQFRCSPVAVKHEHDKRKKDCNNIQTGEMKYLQRVKSCTRIDKLKNGDTRTDMRALRLPGKKNMEYKTESEKCL